LRFPAEAEANSSFMPVTAASEVGAAAALERPDRGVQLAAARGSEARDHRVGVVEVDETGLDAAADGGELLLERQHTLDLAVDDLALGPVAVQVVTRIDDAVAVAVTRSRGPSETGGAAGGVDGRRRC